MSARVTRYLALFAGVSLIVAGVTIPLWMATPGIGDVQAAQILSDNQVANWIHALTVLLSCVLIAPVIVMLCVRLYRPRPALALFGGTTFLLGLVLEAVGTMSSLARHGGAMVGAAEGNLVWLTLYRSLTTLYLAVDFSGVALIYVAGLLLAVALWRLHRLASYLLGLSIILLVVAGLVPAFFSLTVLAGSITVYGLAYGSLGYAAVDAPRTARPAPAAEDAPAPRPIATRTSKRRRRR